MCKTLSDYILSFLVIIILTAAAVAQKGDVEVKQIRFARGKSAATVKGVIKDRSVSKIYRVSARAGQVLTVTFNSPRKDIDVCLFLPNKTDLCGERKYSIKLERDGDYEILVDGHRENIPFTLTVSIK